MSNNNNWHASSQITPENVADFSIDDDDDLLIDTTNNQVRGDYNSNNNNNFYNNDDDIMIEPDILDPLTKKTNNNTTTTSNAPMGSTNGNGNNNDSGYFNFSSYTNPFSATGFTSSINNNIDSNIQTRERQFSGGNTLDESVFQTMKRDIDKIGLKLLHIFWPILLRSKLITVQKFTRLTNRDEEQEEEEELDEARAGMTDGESEEISRDAILKILDWDLWGPLLITLLLSLSVTYLQIRSLDPKYETKASQVFSGAFTLIWASLLILLINTQLLSPFHDKSSSPASSASATISLSLFQLISIFGYAMFPILVGSIVSIFVTIKLIRIAIFAVLLVWSIYAAYLIIKIVNNSGANRGKGDDRIFLIVYPILLVFGVFSWLCVIS